MSEVLTLSEVLVIGSNLAVAGTAVVLAFVTYKDVNKEDQITIRDLIAKLPVVGAPLRATKAPDAPSGAPEAVNVSYTDSGDEEAYHASLVEN